MELKQKISVAFCLLILAMSAVSCLPEKEVHLNLPDYEPELVVECFLEPGMPIQLVLSESNGFVDAIDTHFVENALVIISHDGIHDTIHKAFNFLSVGLYFSNVIIPEDYTTTYELYASAPDGRVLTGTTKIMPPVNISSMDVSYNQDSLAAVTVRWLDFANTDNYYRFTLHKGTLFKSDADSTNDRGLQFDFTLDDRIGDGEFFTISTLFNYKSGDTLIGSVYHISEDYWRYINSASDAASSNGNPFAQPGILNSTVIGGIGAFTGYSIRRDTVVVP